MISVVVPVYNAKEYLPALIESILSQTYSELELILVDDGSIDGSGEICDMFSRLDKRVIVIHKENGGQGSARNMGLEIASGEVIAFADHDDVLHPRAYEFMLEAMEAKKTAVCVCQSQAVNQKDFSAISFSDTTPRTFVVENDEWVGDIFKPTWRTPIWNKIYRAETLKGIRFGDLRLGEDNLFSYQVIKASGRACFVDKILYYQRMHGENFEYTGMRYFTHLLRAKEMILSDSKKHFPREYKKFHRLFLCECVRIWNAYGENRAMFEAEMKETLEIIRRNSKGIWFSKMPIGHKLLFSKLRFSKASNLENHIAI